MTETSSRRFAVAHIGPEGRVALCEILGEVIEAKTWKEARCKIDSTNLEDRPGYGAQTSAELSG